MKEVDIRPTTVFIPSRIPDVPSELKRVSARPHVPLEYLFRSRRKKKVEELFGVTHQQINPEFFFNLTLNLNVQVHEILPHMTNSPDFKEALDLFEKNFVGPDEPTRSEFPLLLKKKIYRVFILKKDDLPDGKSVAGVAVTATYGQKSAIHIEYVAISDACQGKGLGTILMRSLIMRLQNEFKSVDNGPKLLTLECEKKLIGFYSRLGFQLSPTPPRVFKILSNGKQVPHNYFFLGAPLTPAESIADYLDNDNFVLPYKNLLLNKSRDVLKLIKKHRKPQSFKKIRRKDRK